MKNAAYFFATLLAYGFVQLFGAPKAVLGWTLLAFLDIHQYLIQWLCYSIIYWACDLPQEDNFVLIAITTLAYAAIISVGVLLPQHLYDKNKSLIKNVIKFIIILPVVCNNLLFHPMMGSIRFVCYVILRLSEKDFRDITGVYLLFSKSETFIALIIWHVFMDLLSKRTPHPSLLPVVTTPREEKEDDIHKLAGVIKSKHQTKTSGV